jgi:Ca2+-binding EF-hand superfamily protein
MPRSSILEEQEHQRQRSHKSLQEIHRKLESQPAERKFKHADANQDGKATLTEFTCMYSKQFDGLDKNKDGLLMVDEM